MSKYYFGSVVDRYFRNTLQRLADDAAAQGKAIQDLVAEGQLTEEQYSNLIATINGHLKSGEVDRFDLSQGLRAEINQLRNKIDIGNVSLNDLRPDVLEAINSGDGASFEILSIPRDRSVTPEKTTFVFKSTNLLDVDSLEKEKSLTEAAGLPTGSEGNAISDFIEVGHLTNFSIKDVLQLARYDTNKNFISLVYPSDTTSTIPAGAEYIRVTVRIANFDTAQINEGPELLPYEPYYFKLDDRISGGNDFSDALTEENEEWVI